MNKLKFILETVIGVIIFLCLLFTLEYVYYWLFPIKSFKISLCIGEEKLERLNEYISIVKGVTISATIIAVILTQRIVEEYQTYIKK